MKNALRLVSLMLFLAGLVGVARAAEMVEPGLAAGSVIVPDGTDAASVQQAILMAATGRGWNIKEKSDGRVVLFLERHSWRSTLTLTYDTKEIKIFSNSGKLDRKGEIKKQEIPDWVKYLKQDMSRHLGIKMMPK